MPPLLYSITMACELYSSVYIYMYNAGNYSFAGVHLVSHSRELTAPQHERESFTVAAFNMNLIYIYIKLKCLHFVIVDVCVCMISVICYI